MSGSLIGGASPSANLSPGVCPNVGESPGACSDGFVSLSPSVIEAVGPSVAPVAAVSQSPSLSLLGSPAWKVYCP